MPRTHLEVEHTYAPPLGAEVPDLAGAHGLPGVARVSDPVVHELHATYHDTAGLALVAAGVTLRARSGGPDEGWHLKLPAPGGRDEVHHRLGRGEAVPARLRDLVVPWTRGEALVPVATITTRRTSRLLLAEDGTVLAELADDEVTGTPAGGAPVSWREWELELVAGGVDLLPAADALFTDLGIEPRPLARKIVATLGDAMPRVPEVEDPVVRSLTDAVAGLKLLDSRLRRGEAVAAELAAALRRIRSALWLLRPVWGRTETDPVRAELVWLSEVLAEAADLEAVRGRVDALLDEEREGVAPVARLVRSTFDGREKEIARAVLESLRDERYLALLRALDRLAEETSSDRAPTRKVLRRRMRKAGRKVAARLSEGTVDRARARSAAQRWQHAAELAEPRVGKEARKAARRARGLVQALDDELGRAQAQREVKALAATAATTGEAFLLGRVHARLGARSAG